MPRGVGRTAKKTAPDSDAGAVVETDGWGQAPHRPWEIRAAA